MLVGGRVAKTESMTDTTAVPDPRLAPTGAKARDDINRQRFIIRRLLRHMTVKEHEMERAAIAFDVAEQRTKAAIEDNWRVAHWGQEPLRPPAWQSHPGT
jgi:hypothetical protein